MLNSVPERKVPVAQKKNVVDRSKKRNELVVRLMRLSLRLIQQLARKDPLPEILLVSTLGRIVTTARSLYGKGKVDKSIRESWQEKVAEEKGMCLRCQERPALKKIPLCLACYKLAKKDIAEFEESSP